MEQVIVVETLDKRGNVIARTKPDSLPFTIGRSLDNAVIVDDPWASPQHAEVYVSNSDKLMIRDLDSENGLILKPTNKHIANLEIQSSCVLGIGRQSIRLRIPGEQLAATRVPSTMARRATLLMTNPVCIGLLFITATLVNIDFTHTTTWEEISVAKYLSRLVIAYAAIGSWTIGWGCLTYQTRHELRLGPHLATACTLYVFQHVFRLTAEFLGFMGMSTPDALILRPSLDFILLAAGITAALVIAEALRPATRAAAAIIAATAVVGLFRIDDRITGDSDWTVYLPFQPILNPIDPKWLPVQDSEEFFNDVRKMEARHFAHGTVE
jgi:hypothetical protein